MLLLKFSLARWIVSSDDIFGYRSGGESPLNRIRYGNSVFNVISSQVNEKQI